MHPFKQFLFVFFFLFPGMLFACINEYFPTELPLKDNKVNLWLLLNRPGEGQRPYWSPGFYREGLRVARMDSLQRLGMAKMDYRTLSDYAVMCLKRGLYREAIELLEPLFTAHPQEYNIVANLGTAYELNGEPEKALPLLRKAVALMPASHYASEWIHIKVLEQKLGSQQYQQVIDLGIKDFSQWIIDKKYVFPRPADSLLLQLAYQLHERIGFVAPPDTVVGQLVLDFADIVAKHIARDSAVAFYDYAVQYAPTLQGVVAGRKAVLKAEQQEVSNTFRYASLVWALPLLAFFLILLAWMKAMKRQQQSGSRSQDAGGRSG